MMFPMIQGFLDGLKPEPLYTVSEWADAHRMLDPKAAAEPGRWRTSRTPYLQEIMDNLSSSSPYEEIIFMKGAQIGATEAGYNWIGYIIDAAPGPALMVMPTVDTVKRNSKQRFDPMIEATPRLQSKIKAKRSRDSGNTMMQKDFPGGTIIMAGANSAAGLRSLPIRWLMLDEVDAYPTDLDGEGGPVELATARTRTFANRKIFKVSTPTIKNKSIIEAEFETTDQRFFHIPCPHCEELQNLKFSNLKWEKGRPDTAAYACEHCGTLIEERFKPRMLAGGRWISSKPENENRRKVGYHLNSLYSPYGWHSWETIADEWEKAQGKPEKMKTFINTTLGETWEEKGEAPEWERLYERRLPYEMNKPPKEVVFLTAGVDVQKDRLELEIVGWGRERRTWSIDYRVILGDTSSLEPWNKLAEVVNEQWTREDGLQMPLKLLAVDTGYNTHHAYDFARRFDTTRVIAVKGRDNQDLFISTPRDVDINLNGRKVGRTKLWNVAVSQLKSELYGFLKMSRNEDGTTPFGFCEFPMYGVEFFKGLTAEQLETTVDKRGFRQTNWVKHYDRNEPLDCRVYARAAATLIGIDRFKEEHWEAMEKSYQTRTSTPKRKRSRESDFW